MGERRQDLRKNIQIEEVEERVTGWSRFIQERVQEKTSQGT
jgi:hypothetical protein